MRKAFSLLLLLAAVCAAGLGGVYAYLSTDIDQVVITEEVLFGDKAHAQGLNLHVTSHLYDHLFWDTHYTIGEENTAQTTYQYHQTQQHRRYEPTYHGLTYQHGYSHNWDESPHPGMRRMYEDLLTAARGNPGVETAMVIRLADYCDYYPLDFSLDLPGFILSPHHSLSWEDEGLRDWEINELQVRDTLTEYFRIPVLPEETLSVHMTVQEDGHPRNWGSGSTGSGSFYAFVHSVVSQDTCYIAMSNHDSSGAPMDFSLVPGGYGIHALPFEVPEEGRTRVDADALALVYPLDETSQIQWLALTPDQERLLLMTLEENEDCMLRVIRCEDMETLQELVLYRSSEKRQPQLQEYRDGHILLSNSGWQLILLEEAADGTFEMKLDIQPGSEGRLSYELGASHWDGEKLVMAYSDNHYHELWETGDACGFAVAVYDRTGPLFGGVYTSSLNDGNYDHFSRDNCSLWDDLTISWG